MHFLPDISFLHLAPFLLFGLWSNSGGNSSNPQTTTETSTTSGSGSPSATGGSQAVGTGSIGVSGAGAKYQEQGATDLSGSGTITGSNINASSGGSVQIGSPQAVDALSQIAEQLASNNTALTTGSGGGGAGGVYGIAGGGNLSSTVSSINWTVIAILGVAGFLIYSLFGKQK